MANITVDIQAKVVGYEQSIKALQAALAKIDPGSELGKSITKAMEQAQSQVKALSKNMFPKASSDTQIDSIIEKTNRAGEAIQNVAALLQGVQIGDLNLGAFGGDIENFRNQISSLETELNTKLNQGILNTVNSSDQLKSIFQQLGTDLTKADASTLFKDLQRGASEAAKEVATAEAALKKIQDKQHENELIGNKLQGSLLITEDGRKQLDVELNNIMNQYGNNFDAIQQKMKDSISKLNLGDNGQKLLDNFFQDLTPDNIIDRINTLYNELSSHFGNKKGEFYQAIFGEGKSNVQVAKLFDFSQDTEQVKNQLRAFIDKVKDEIKPERAVQIKRLIDQGQLEQAAQMTSKELDAAYGKVQSDWKKYIERAAEYAQQQGAAQQKLDVAQTNKSNIDAANTQLIQQIEQLRQQNESLQQQINSLREQLGQKLGAEVGNIRNAGATENRNMGQGFKESLELSQAYKEQLAQVAAKEQALGKLQGVVQRWFSIYAAIRMVRQAINSVISTVKELDATITNIAIVTSMDQSELWDQMPKYTQLARDYAASISGVYQVSQLYYQQGLQTADVMALTEQTLKMARISGLDYAQATDYMTNAVRSFKMEMTEAQTVVDVYSAIAASSATSVTELASAMSKTASSAQAVGSSFESTTAMMAVMIEATRESAENIGSAMKSIISRYGEMTSDPSKAVDSEGQEMSLNRVDKALQTVGISIHNAAGEFRNFDDVIMELAEKWNTIDTNTQRYIATIMAGNRQQSRFLALVSSYDRLKELSAEAAESEDAAQLQFLKTLDSVEAKTQQFQTSVQALYVNSGIEDFYKGLLDWANQVITSLDQLSDKFGTLAAVGKIGATFTTLATLVTNIFNSIKMSFSNTRAKIAAEGKIAAADEILNQQRVGNEIANINNQKVINNQETQRKITQDELAEIQKRKEAEEQHLREINAQNASKTKIRMNGGMIASAAGLVATTAAASIDVNENRGLKKGLTAAGGILSGVGTGLMIGGPAGIIIGALTALPSILEAIGMASESTAEKVQKLSDAIQDTNNKKLESKSELTALTEYKKKYDELASAQYDSAEAKEEFIKIQNDIAATYPELISSMTIEGNYVVDMANGYKQLAAAKMEAYKSDYLNNLSAELDGLNSLDYVLTHVYSKQAITEHTPLIGSWVNNTSTANQIRQKDLNKLEINESTVQDLFGKFSPDTAGIKYHSGPSGAGAGGLIRLILDAVTGKQIYTLTDEGKDFYRSIIEQAREYAAQGFTNQDATEQLVNDSPKEFSEEISNFMKNNYDDLVVAMKAIEYQDELIDNRMHTAMTEWISVLGGMTEQRATGFQGAVIANRLDTEWETFQKNVEEGTQKDAAGLTIDKNITDENGKTRLKTQSELWKEFINLYDYQWYRNIEEHTRSLQKTGIDNLYNEMGKFSFSQIQETETFKNLGEYQEDFIIEYNRKATSNIEAYDRFIANNFEKDSNIQKTLSGLKDKFGFDFFPGLTAQITRVLDNTNLSKGLQNSIIDNIANIYTEAGKIISPDIRATVTSKLNAADLTSLFGITNFISELSTIEGFDLDASGISTYIDTLKRIIPINVGTEVESYFAQIESEVDDFSKALSSATKGMDLKAAHEMATRLGTDLNDESFEVINGKFYYRDLEAIRKAYLSENDQLKTDVINNLTTQYEQLEKYDAGLWHNINNNFYTTEDLKKVLNYNQFQDIGDKTSFTAETLLAEYSKYQQALASEAIQSGVTFLDYLIGEINTGFDNANTDSYLTQNVAMSQLASGNIDGFLSTLGYGKYNDKDLEDAKKQAEAARQTNEQAIKEANKGKQSEDYGKYFTEAREEFEAKGYMSQVLFENEVNDRMLKAQDLYASLSESDSFEQYLIEQGDILSLQDLGNEAYEKAKSILLAYFGEDKYNAILNDFYDKYRDAEGNISDEDIKKAEIDFINTSSGPLLGEGVKSVGQIYKELLEQRTEKINQFRTNLRKQATVTEYMEDIVQEELGIVGVISNDEIEKSALEKLEAARKYNATIDASVEKLPEDYGYYLKEAQKEAAKLITDAEWDANVDKILSGNISDVSEDFQPYAAFIYDTYQSINENIANSMISAIGDGNGLIKVTETNKAALDKIMAEHKDWLSGKTTVGSYVTIAAEKLLDSAQTFEQFIVASFDTNADRIKALTEAHNNQYKNSSIESFDKVLTTENFAYEDLLNYLVNTKNVDLTEHVADIPTYMEAMGLAFNSVGEVIITNYEAWIKELEWTANMLKNDPNASQEEQNSIQAKLNSARYAQEQAIASAFDDVLKDHSNISVEAIETLANSLGISFDEVLTYLTANGDGSYRLDMTKIKNLIAKTNGKVSEATLQAINQSIGSVADDYSKSLEDARTYIRGGTTSREDMEKFVEQYNQLTGESLNADQAFIYNSTKKKWVLQGEYVIRYAQKRAEQLQLVDDEYNQYINDLFRADVGESIISTIDAIGTQQFEDNQKDLLASLTTYYTNIYKTKMPSAAVLTDGNIQETGAQVFNAVVDGAGQLVKNVGQFLGGTVEQESHSIADQIGRKQIIASATPMSKFGGFYASSTAANFITTLTTIGSTAMASINQALDPALAAAQALTTILAGGNPAVQLYKTINPQATQEELEKIFYSRMNALNSAINEVDQLVAGQFVGTEGKLYEILKRAGAIDSEADGVVAEGFSMIEVYTQIYAEMYHTLGHTNADLNNIYAKLLTEQDKQQVTLKDVLDNAGGMSYEAFAQLMNTYDLDMRTVMDEQAHNLIRDGFGNIIITNFKSFSDYMKDNGADWDFTSPAIKAAYNSYVDAKVELLNQDAKDVQSLADQIIGLTEAKPKTAINVSYIESALGADTLTEIATRFNAALHDGILTITDYTNIPGLIDEIVKQQSLEDKLLPEQLAELADAVHGLLSDITSLINDGINGSLNNVDAQKLLSWYRKYTGNQEAQLQFTNTEDGLKLSSRSARELYTIMRQVDALQGDIVFNELKNSLIESEDHFKTIQSTAAYIAELRKGTIAPNNSGRIADLQEELALAEKINAERSTTEDDSFKFMEGKIPAGQNNPLNYWQNWAEAFNVIKASMKGNKKSKNTMAYEDFYNIVTEMGNLTKLTGQAVQYGDVLVDDSANAAEKSVTAAELIESAAGALKNVDGKLVVDLSKIGVDLNMSSLKGLGEQLDTQVDAVADSQIEMLESIARLLEVIVAMENLKDIDVDFDGKIDLTELFSDWEIKGADATEFTTKAQDAAKKILSQADAMGEDSPLYEALKAVRINGYTIRQILEDATDGIRNLDLNAEQYQAAINALYQAMMSNDYDLNNIGESLFNILSEAGLDSVAVNVGEKTYYLTGNTRYIVDWSDEDAVKAATEALKAANFWANGKDVESNIQDAIDKLNNEDIELTQEQRVNLEYAVAIATGSVSIKQNTDKKAKEKGGFVGNYKGQTFYSDNKESLENVIKDALGLEEEGFTVKIDEQANIDATYKQGKTNIKYDPNAEEKKYIVEGEYGGTYSTLKEATEAQISQGFANQSDIGTYDIKGKDFEVAYSSELKAAYSIHHSALKGNIYYYNGQQFSSYDNLIAYISATNLTQNEKKWEQSGSRESGNETFTYKKNGEIKIIIDYSSGEPKITYEAFGKQFTNSQDIAKLIQIQDLVDASEGKGGKIYLDSDTGNIEAQFVYDGMIINATINTDTGDFIYKFNDPETGTSIEASSLSALKSAIAAILGKESSNSEDNSGTITVNGVSFTYKMNAEGHIIVELTNPAEMNEEIEKERAAIQERLNQDQTTTSGEAQPVNITAASVNVTLADNASVTLDGELTDDQKTIKDLPPMKGEVSELELTMANNATIALDTQGKDLELKDTVKAEGDIEELTLNINSEGEASTVKLAETPAILSDTIDAEGTVNTLTLSTTAESTVQMSESSVEIQPNPIPEATGEVTNLKITNSTNTEITGYAEPKPIPSVSAKVTTLQLSADNVEIDIGSDGNEGKNLEAEATIKTTSDVAEQVAADKALLNSLASEISNPTISTTSDVAGVVGAAESALARINGKSAHTYVYTHYVTTGGGGTISETSPQVPDGNGGYMNATGNIGLAKSKGTLMGELGPELVVSNGRYFVAGQNGAEMVNLADDAIVFNHLQTEQLLKNGMSSGRGRAVTNERNAVAFATGNINGGPAMASASAALNAVKQLISMWKSLKSASVSDLAGAGGGGGGGGGEQAKVVDPKAWVDTVERWFNLMQDIAQLEYEITYQEKIRTKISSDWQKNGKAYYESQTRSLKALKDQIAAQEQLNLSRQEYFDKRIEALKDEPLGQIYSWDPNTGKMNFNPGQMEWLTDLVGFDNNKGANYTNKEKYDILMARGFANYMKYDSNGMEIKADSDNDGTISEEEQESFYENATKAFWDKVDEFKESTESLHESIQEGNEKIEESQSAINERLKEITDNQLAVEDAVLNAIEESRQREIDNLQEQRDKLEESVGNYIDGLSEALEKEQKMYEDQDAQDELNRNRRRLAILQRAGGSVSDINSLQAEIRDQERNMYYDAQQAQIDAIQEASDLELERLDNQIDIMTQQLEYQKEFGLLWNDVYEVMNRSSEFITSFIAGNTESFWESSPLKHAEQINDTLFQAEQWVGYRTTSEQEAKDIGLIAQETRRQMHERDFTTYNEAMIKEFGADYDSSGRYAGIFNSVYAETASLSEASEAARRAYHDEVIAPREAARRAAEAAAAAAAAEAAAQAASSGSGGGGGGTGDSNSGGKQVARYERSGSRYRIVYMDGTYGPWKEEGAATASAQTWLAKYDKQDAEDKKREEQEKKEREKREEQERKEREKREEQEKRERAKQDAKIQNKIDKSSNRARGGYVGHGIYELGEQGTETVLTASQTQVLRNNILSNRPSSLISLLKTYNEGFSRMDTPLTGAITEDNSTNIDKLEFSMNVQQISNDYDARRAGEQAMNEIMRIARKTSAANSIRR